MQPPVEIRDRAEYKRRMDEFKTKIQAVSGWSDLALREPAKSKTA